MTQSFRSLAMAFALAVFLVYLVMASQFESLLHPFVILFTIPMGLIGSIWGLYITGTTINSVALIGLIMLAGIVVNNAIVLIDAINQARERGLERIEAIKLAGTHAPAPHPHHQREHCHRSHPDGHRHRRRRRNPPAHGHHRNRRHAGRHLPHAGRDPGAVCGAGPQGIREVPGRPARRRHLPPRPHRQRPRTARSANAWSIPTSRCADPSPRSWRSPPSR